MDLYFSPLACSMGARIALYEAGADARFVEVDAKTKHTRDGSDYRAINPLGLVPALRTDEDEVMTENAAVLQYVADQFPAADLAPPAGMGRSRLHQWLCFIGTELHKGLFMPLLDRTAPDASKSHALQKGESRLAYLDRHLAGRDYLLDRFSVADAYLFAVLNWSGATAVDLARWPAIKGYYERLRQRPSIAKALAEERALFAAQQARHKAA